MGAKGFLEPQPFFEVSLKFVIPVIEVARHDHRRVGVPGFEFLFYHVALLHTVPVPQIEVGAIGIKLHLLLWDFDSGMEQPSLL